MACKVDFPAIYKNIPIFLAVGPNGTFAPKENGLGEELQIGKQRKRRFRIAEVRETVAILCSVARNK